MSNGKIYFDLAEAVRIAEATLEAPEFRVSFSDSLDGIKTGPSLMWVKDAGCYLMSNATPRPESDVLYGRAYTHDGLLLQQPSDTSSAAWGEVWETARAICGGDDFAEYFPLDDMLPQMRVALAAGCTHLVIDVSDEALDITMEAR